MIGNLLDKEEFADLLHRALFSILVAAMGEHRLVDAMQRDSAHSGSGLYQRMGQLQAPNKRSS